MKAFFSRIFGKKTISEQPEAESFAARFHRFKLFLSSHIEAYSEIMAFEERLAGQAPVGTTFLRVCTAKLTVATMYCIMQLNALGNQRYRRLNEPFAALRNKVQEFLGEGTYPLEGPLALSLHELEDSHAQLVAPNLIKIAAIRKLYPEFVPTGFVLTGAAWWRYYNTPEIHDEVDRIMIISQGDSAGYEAASSAIRDKLLHDFPLPDEIIEAVKDGVQALREHLQDTNSSLLIRCFPVRSAHTALVMPEQIINDPLHDMDGVIAGVHSAFAMAYRRRAIIYRMKLGVRDRAMPLCLSLTVLPNEQVRGSAYRAFEGNNKDNLIINIRRGLSKYELSGNLIEGEVVPETLRLEIETKCKQALDCVADAPIPGNRHEIYWATSESGQFFVLGVIAVPDPVLFSASELLSLRESLPSVTHGKCQFPVSGGVSFYPGVARGKPVLVRNIRDALLFPVGSILVVKRASARWTFLLAFASGAIAGEGTETSLFARVARRFGRPVILGASEVVQSFVTETCEQDVLIVSSAESPCTISFMPHEDKLTCVFDPEDPHQRQLCSLVSQQDEKAEMQHSEDTPASLNAGQHANLPIKEPSETIRSLPVDMAGYLWLPNSEIAAMARKLAPLVAMLSLPDAEDPDFRAENCVTFHDFLTYCHDHAVQEMFRFSTSRKTSSSPAKQLVCDVPKQFWIINLDDGFYREVNGPSVHLEDIASIPMRSLWEGFIDKPWDGPPQLDAKGFLSVLFEATQNPNLDPASQSTQYTEKNVFLIANRFCSMRCRFGFHFLSLDAFLSEREKERFIIFQFKGGAADISRRIRRVRFVSELLAQFDFASEITGDTLVARLEGCSEEKFLSSMRVLGYLVMHTRQLDMIMTDEEALRQRRRLMLEDMQALALRPPLDLPEVDFNK